MVPSTTEGGREEKGNALYRYAVLHKVPRHRARNVPKSPSGSERAGGRMLEASWLMHNNPVSQRRNDALLRHTEGKEMSGNPFAGTVTTRTLLFLRGALQRHHLTTNRYDQEADWPRQHQLSLFPCLL